MKNLWVSASLLGLLFPVCYGETLQFVTRLSAPLGAVAQLDTADPSALTEVPRVNFCTQQATSGDVSFTGGADPQFGTVSLGANRQITSDNLQELRVNYIYLRSGGSLTAGRLFADKITLPANKTTRGSVGESLYLNNISSFVDVQGVKADALYIKDNSGNNLAFINEAGSGTALHWSNAYDKEYVSASEKKENAAYTTQWLLKGDTDQLCNASSSKVANCKNSGGTFYYGKTPDGAASCACVCPSTKWLSGEKCVSFVPKIRTVDVWSECHFPEDHACICYSCGAGSTCCKKATTPTVNSYVFYEPGGTAGYSTNGKWLYWWNGATQIKTRGSSNNGVECADTSQHAQLCQTNCTKNASTCSYNCIVSSSPASCQFDSYAGGCQQLTYNAISVGGATLMECKLE